MSVCHAYTLVNRRLLTDPSLDYGSGYMTSRGARSIIGALFNIFLICVGLFTLTAGTYASVESIIMGYDSASFGGPFSCANNGLAPAVTAATATAKRWILESAGSMMRR